MPVTAGTRLGPYEIVALLGAGGMGEVYRARDTRLHRDVAIKVLPEQIAPGACERFQREARAASALSHPSICAVYDLCESEGRSLLVMELVDGVTVRERAGNGPMPSADVVAIGVQIADALDAAHGTGVIHRDIKPGNIMITGRGHVKVLDFGLARQIVSDQRDETRMLEQAPGNISAVRFLTLAYLDIGDLDNVQSLLESKRQQFEHNYSWRATRALALARQGRRNEALATMDDDTLKYVSVAFISTIDAAEFYALMGDTSNAIEWLERAVRNGDERIAWFRRDPRLVAIRTDPRFLTIIDSVEARRRQRQLH